MVLTIDPDSEKQSFDVEKQVPDDGRASERGYGVGFTEGEDSFTGAGLG